MLTKTELKKRLDELIKVRDNHAQDVKEIQAVIDMLEKEAK